MNFQQATHDAAHNITQLEHLLHTARNQYTAAPLILHCLMHFYHCMRPDLLPLAHGLSGAGGYGAQCGLLEGILLFLGLWGNKQKVSTRQIEQWSYQAAQGFEYRFGSLICHELQPHAEHCSHAALAPACEALALDVLLYGHEFIGSLALGTGTGSIDTV